MTESRGKRILIMAASATRNEKLPQKLQLKYEIRTYLCHKTTLIVCRPLFAGIKMVQNELQIFITITLKAALLGLFEVTTTRGNTFLHSLMPFHEERLPKFVLQNVLQCDVNSRFNLSTHAEAATTQFFFQERK